MYSDRMQSFDLRLEYVGNNHRLRITERRKSFSAFIQFKSCYISWFCEVLDQACMVLDLGAIIRSKDDGNRVLVIKGRSNALGPFLKIYEIHRNGKEFVIIIPSVLITYGWANMVYVLCRDFGGYPISSQPSPLSSWVFLPCNAWNDSNYWVGWDLGRKGYYEG